MSIAPKAAGKEFALQLTTMKDKMMRAGFYRTARLLDIATQEIGWEMQGEDTPKWQKERQQETLTPGRSR